MRSPKGRGYAGVIKRHHFSGFPGSHGTHEYFRHGGSIGNRSYPGRVRKGLRMAGQMGNEAATILNLEVVEVLAEDNAIAVAGAVPGADGAIVTVKHAAKPRHRTDRGRPWLRAGANRSGQAAALSRPQRERVGEIEVSGRVFGRAGDTGVLHEAVRMQLAKRRAGTAATKTRGLISGGGRKPWRQKGTGRARAGSTRSPLWRHGGTTFGPQPRDYSYKMPKQGLASRAVPGDLRSRAPTAS